MNYTVYNKESGKIERTLSCAEIDISLQYDAELYAHLAGVYTDDCFYVENGIVIEIPTKPGAYYSFNYTTKQWEDPRTLADLKATQWTLIKQARTNAEYAGFTWDGSAFDSDAISQNRITGAVSLAMMSPEFTIGWTLFDNTVRTLNQTDMLQVGAALGTHVATQFAKGVILREQINAATTPEEVAAVVW